MKTPTLFLVAISTPLLLCASAMLPSYGGILGACYIIYTPQSGAHPLADKMLDVLYVIESYGKLFDYWSNNRAALDFVDYTLPIIGLPLFGFLIAFWLTFRIGRGMLRNFQLNGAVN